MRILSIEMSAEFMDLGPGAPDPTKEGSPVSNSQPYTKGKIVMQLEPQLVRELEIASTCQRSTIGGVIGTALWRYVNNPTGKSESVA